MGNWCVLQVSLRIHIKKHMAHLESVEGSKEQESRVRHQHWS